MKHSSAEGCIAAVVDLLNDAGSTTVAKRDGFLARAREITADCLEQDPENAAVNYIAGLAMYKSFYVDETYGIKAEKYLRKAISLDPEHQFARLYLGHYFYDTERYQEALECFHAVDQSYFKSIDQLWRVLTLHEPIICCRIFLEDRRLTEHDFDLLAEEFQRKMYPFRLSLFLPW